MSEIKKSILNTIENGLQIITFNTPKKKNAISQEMYKTLIKLIQESSLNKEVFALIFTGNGDFYSSGNDMGMLGQDQDNQSDSPLHLYKKFTEALILYPKLLIAMVNGPAIGLAMTTLSLFDIVYASENAFFLTPFSKIGFTAEGCSTYTFPMIFGTSKASEILYLGYKLSAEEALKYGFVSKLFNDKSIKNIWAEIKKIPSLSLESIMGSKKLVRKWHVETLLHVNEEEMKLLSKTVASEKFMETLLRYLSNKNKI